MEPPVLQHPWADQYGVTHDVGEVALGTPTAHRLTRYASWPTSLGMRSRRQLQLRQPAYVGASSLTAIAVLHPTRCTQGPVHLLLPYGVAATLYEPTFVVDQAHGGLDGPNPCTDGSRLTPTVE
jgi:hypothetical protein